MAEANEAYFERERRLREQLDQGFPPSWKPDTPGETLTGIFVARDVGPTQYGPKFIVVLENPSTKERTSVWLLHTALESQFRRAQPNIGELVAIKYEGKVMAKDGKNEYDNWTVMVDRPAATSFDWGSPGAAVGQRASDAAPPAGAATERYAPPPADDDIPF